MPLPLASDERRGQIASDRCVAKHVEQAIGLDRSRLPLQLERFEHLGVDGVPDERQRLGSDEDLSVRRRLLEAGGDVDGIAGHERLALPAHDDLAGVDPDPGLQLVRCDRLAHLGGGADGPQSVVLVGHRNPEDGHDRISHELLDGAAVTLDDRAEILEVAAHARAQRLRIGGLPERSRADEVAEEDVTTLRCSRAGSTPGSAVPHALQKRASPAFWRPQLEHADTRGVYEARRRAQLVERSRKRAAETLRTYRSSHRIAPSRTSATRARVDLRTAEAEDYLVSPCLAR